MIDETSKAGPAQSGKSMPWLVSGVTGYMGGHLAPYLLDQGIPVRAMARTPEKLAGVRWPERWPHCEIVRGDVLDPDSLVGKFDGVRVAFYLIHAMCAGRHYMQLEIDGARNFAEAAGAAGVERVFYIGGLVPDGADTQHILARKRIGDTLREGSVPVTEIRAGIIVGPGSAAFEVMRDAIFHLPFLISPPYVDRVSPPIALENICKYAMELAVMPEAAGEIFDAAGPDVMTYADQMRIIAEVGGIKPRKILRIPFLTERMAAVFLPLVSAVPSSIAGALIEGMRQNFTADDSRIRELVPQRLLNYREATEAVYEEERNQPVYTRWVDGGFIFRGMHHHSAYYGKQATGNYWTKAGPESVWKIMTRIGGDNRYFYLNILWTIREWIDWLVGGRGRTRFRRDPEVIELGDAIDSWEVIAMEPGERFTLRFGMKAPGDGVLEFAAVPEGEGTRIHATATWHPAGIWGLLYWHAMYLPHLVLFNGLTRKIGERAERLEAEENNHA